MQDTRIWKERLAARLKQRADLLGEISLPSSDGSNWQHTMTSSITRKDVVLRPPAANNNCNWKIFMTWGVNCNVIALCCHMLSMCVCVSLSPLLWLVIYGMNLTWKTIFLFYIEWMRWSFMYLRATSIGLVHENTIASQDKMFFLDACCWHIQETILIEDFSHFHLFWKRELQQMPSPTTWQYHCT